MTAVDQCRSLSVVQPPSKDFGSEGASLTLGLCDCAGMVVDARDAELHAGNHAAVAGLLAEVLRAAPHLHVVLCSPEPFEIAGEAEMPFHTVVAMSR